MAVMSHTLFMRMIVFNVDMDNTLIYSYKHDIGMNKRCAEIYQGREISFMTEQTQSLLKEVAQKVLVVPTTTRTVEQYNRIDLGLGEMPYVLACNGGVLLINGEEDPEWYAESLELVRDCNSELEKGEQILETDENRSFEVRNIKGLFLFTKSEEPEQSVALLKQKLDASLVDIFSNGVKVYVVPKQLSKGNAVLRLKDKLGAEKIMAAGDSEFDISMLQCADIAVAPESLEVENNYIKKINDDLLFSEEMLRYIIDIVTDVATK